MLLLDDWFVLLRVMNGAFLKEGVISFSRRWNVKNSKSFKIRDEKNSNDHGI
jgi:hypothetical protein